jgi:hypothetical protein
MTKKEINDQGEVMPLPDLAVGYADSGTRRQGVIVPFSSWLKLSRLRIQDTV